MFTPYGGLFYNIKKEKKRRLSKEEFEDFAYYFMHADRMADGHLAQTGIQTLLELVHYHVSHRVLYVKTAFAQRLMESTMEVPPEQLHVPYDLFEMSFEDNFEIMPSIKAPSTLVLLRPQKATVSAMDRYLFKAADYGRAIINQQRKTAGLPEHATAETKITDSVTQALRYHYSSPITKEAMCHLSIPLDRFVGRSVDEVIDEVGVIDNTIKMNDQETEISKRIARIIFGIQCYMNTLEPEIDKYKDRCRPSFVISPNGLMLGKSFRSEVGWHLRKPHWRFLSVASGFKFSRSIWVHASEINKEAKPGAHERSDELPKEEA